MHAFLVSESLIGILVNTKGVLNYHLLPMLIMTRFNILANKAHWPLFSSNARNTIFIYIFTLSSSKFLYLVFKIILSWDLDTKYFDIVLQCKCYTNSQKI